MSAEKKADPQQDALDSAAEREMLLGYLDAARGAIAELRPTEVRFKNLPSAMNEIGMIVETTETAANKIMDTADELLNLPSELTLDEYRSAVEGRAISLMEACAFQDLTGQRITKVVETLLLIEDKLGRLALALGDADEPAAEPAAEANASEDVQPSGPCMPGEGVDQDEIDRLFADD